jgi:hypothetical protein
MPFSEDKTRVVNLDEGFDFLGFTVRRFGAKLLIRPSKAALRRHRARLRDEMRSLRGDNAVMVLQRSPPLCGGRRPTIERWCPARCSLGIVRLGVGVAWQGAYCSRIIASGSRPAADVPPEDQCSDATS